MSNPVDSWRVCPVVPELRTVNDIAHGTHGQYTCSLRGHGQSPVCPPSICDEVGPVPFYHFVSESFEIRFGVIPESILRIIPAWIVGCCAVLLE